MIVAENLSKNYGALKVLKNVSLTINQGEIVSIVGASGAGKSTLLQILGTLDRPTEGIVKINDTIVSDLKDKKLSEFRNKHIGFVFQFHHLLPEFTALENVCIPGFIAKRKQSEVETRAKELLDLLGLKDRFTHKPSEMSGGEQQRVAMARALVNNPLVVFADEPTGNLDSENGTELQNILFDLRKNFNQTFVIVTHNQDFAALADRKLEMKDGVLLS
ncbi:MAG: ABC transporter ATP-binding protein [Bacteroidota bacterium]